MKFATKILLAMLFVSFMSCRDTEKEEAELNATIEEVENINVSLDSITNQVEETTQELEEALEELDSL